MRTVVAVPDWKSFLCAWWRAQPEVEDVFSDRVRSRLTASKVYPVARVARVAGGPMRGHENWLHDPLFQVDVLSDDEDEATDAANVLMSTLQARIVGQHTVETMTATVSSAIVAAVHEGWDDEAQTIARVRFSVRLYAHP